MTKPLESQSIPLDLRIAAANAALAYMNACVHHSQAAANLFDAPNDATLVAVAVCAYDVKQFRHNELLDLARDCALYYEA